MTEVKTNKITQREFFTAVLEHLKESGYSTELISNEKFIEMTEHQIELLNRKSEHRSKGKNAEENELIIAFIIKHLTKQPNFLASTDYLIEQVKANFDTNFGTSRLGQLMTKICGNVDNPLPNAPVKRVRDKRKVYYQAVVAE